jgi:cytochrome c oxidase assembly factor 2
MPPHLHPRSRTTSSLFLTTVFASFVVVALPHLLPCPAPKSVAFADGVMEYVDDNGQRRVRRRKRRPEGSPTIQAASNRENHPFYQRYPGATEVKDGVVQFGAGDDDGVMETRTVKRECPVPKPSGVIGELLGFKPKAEGEEEMPRTKVEVRVRDRRVGEER